MNFGFSQTDFRKILEYQIAWKTVKWEPICSMRTDEHTDMTKLGDAFGNFANKLNETKRFWNTRETQSTWQCDVTAFLFYQERGNYAYTPPPVRSHLPNPWALTAWSECCAAALTASHILIEWPRFEMPQNTFLFHAFLLAVNPAILCQSAGARTWDRTSPLWLVLFMSL